MKLFTLAAAAAAMLAGIAPAAPAAAAPAPAMAAPAPVTAPPAPQRYEERVVTRRTVVRRDRYRPRWASRRVCRNEWRRGQRVRICRTVRYRR